MTAKGSASFPDPRRWQPKHRKGHLLEQAFFVRCKELEEVLKIRAANEKRHNFHQFESGPAIEELLRAELRQLLPKRYSVRAGFLIDRKGSHAGDCDIVIFNDMWFPHALTGPTEDSRRAYYPIEGTYAVIEVKQTLTKRSLDDAMQKLVTCHRLERPLVPADRIAENRETGGCTHFISNPLFSAIVAVDIEGSLDQLVERFFFINQKLKRMEVVHSLCVLGHGAVTWGYFEDNGEIGTATFRREDIYKPIVPVYGATGEDESALYNFLVAMMSHLYNSVLGGEDIASHYGLGPQRVKAPSDPQTHSLQPDREWIERLDSPCTGSHAAGGSADRDSS